MPQVPTKQAFGTCAYSHTSPNRNKVTPETRVLNVIVSYEEALKLNMSLQAALVQMSRYNFATKEGRKAGILLAVHLDQNRLSLHEGMIRESEA